MDMAAICLLELQLDENYRAAKSAAYKWPEAIRVVERAK